MPYELFDTLLRGVSSNPKYRESARRLFAGGIADLGYDTSKFWNTIESVSKTYRTILETTQVHGRRSMMFATATGQRAFVPVTQETCAARFGALQDARKLFGGQAFDRFLYTVVAPHVTRSEAGNAPFRREQLLYMARGCK